jgi:hypothetical protein
MHSCYKGVFDNLKLTDECETIHDLLSSVPLVNMFESTVIQSWLSYDDPLTVNTSKDIK